MTAKAIKIASFVAFGLCAAAPASAQISADPVDAVLGTLGITARERPHIDYRERAPLVVPPSGTGLRAPEERAAARNGRFPVDHDAEKRRRAKALEAGETSYGAGDSATSGRIIRDASGRNRYAGVPTAGTYDSRSDASNPARALTREQVTAIHNSADASTPPSGVDPGRRSLTDPPRGYRAAQGGRPVKATVEPMRSGDSIQIDVNRPDYN